MGAAVAQQIQNGGDGIFLSLSLGERGHPTTSPKDYGALQRAATEKAAKILRAEAAFLSYPDAEIPLSDEASFAVCDLLRQYKPEIVCDPLEGSGVICETHRRRSGCWRRGSHSRESGNLLGKPLEVCCRRTGFPLSRE